MTLEEVSVKVEYLEEKLDEHHHPNGNTLSRIDERLKALHEDVKDIKDNFVRKEEFWPVRTVVYGLVGLVLIGVVGALIALVI